MAIRCSIVGCEYDDTHIEREEERRGEEVILTVREFKECSRCGNTELISENTGVTAVAEPDPEESTAGTDPEPTAGDGTDPAGGSTAGTGGGTGSPTDPDLGDATDPEVTDRATGADVEGATDPDVDDAVVVDGSPTTDDADPAGGPGESDSSPATATADAGADDGWPDHADSDATTVDLGEIEGTGPADDAGAGRTDDPGEERTDDAEFIDGTGDRTGGLDEAAAMEDGPTITGAIEEAEEEYPEDDAVILESSGSDAGGVGVDMDGGEWPEGGEDGVTAGGWPDAPDRDDRDASGGTTTGWPDVDGDDEGWDASGPAPDAEGGTEDVGFSGLTPEGEGETAGAVTAEHTGSGSPATADDGAEPRPGAEATSRDPRDAGASHRELSCSGCGHAVDPESSPLRAGDICPDCSRGYLEDR